MSVSVRVSEAKIRRALKGVLGIVLTASPLAALNHCSTVSADPDDAGMCAPQRIFADSGDEAGAQCETFFFHACGIPQGATPRDNCYFDIDSCNVLCGGPYFTCVAYGSSCVDGAVVVEGDAGLVVECGSCPNGTGRRPHGLRPRRGTCAKKSDTRDRIGEYFERAAYLEDASIHAFRIMQVELAAHGAPEALISAAKRAERDEVRHALVTRNLARAHGGNSERARVSSRPVRSLEAMAIENAVEGCVRETYGALVAMWQAKAARDPAIARAMKKIAADETRHAALSWSLASWIESRLDAAARARVAAARKEALEALHREIAAPVDRALVVRAGIPVPCVQRKMLALLEPALSDATSLRTSPPTTRAKTSSERPCVPSTRARPRCRTTTRCNRSRASSANR